MKNKTCGMIVIAALLSNSPAEAGTGRLTLANRDWVGLGNTLERSDFSTLLQGVGTASIYLSFAIPGNYAENTPITVRMRLMSGDANCTLLIKPESAARMRIGKKGSGGGFVHKGIAAVASPAVGKVFVKEFILKKPNSGAIQSQKPGDGIVLMMTRFPSDTRDTCPGDVAVHYVDIIYQTN